MKQQLTQTYHLGLYLLETPKVTLRLVLIKVIQTSPATKAKPTHTETYAYRNLRIPKPTHTETYAYRNLRIPKPTHTETYAYRNLRIPKPTHRRNGFYVETKETSTDTAEMMGSAENAASNYKDLYEECRNQLLELENKQKLLDTATRTLENRVS